MSVVFDLNLIFIQWIHQKSEVFSLNWIQPSCSDFSLLVNGFMREIYARIRRV